MRGSREVLEEVHRLGYGVSGPIARGAFLLERISDGRPAVLRVLPWNYGWSERFTAHVAPAWRRVAEPRVVRLLAVGPQASGFLIREHVDGIDLRALLRRGPLPAALGAHVATQLCAALTALHREAGPHLRLWPGHVLISSEGSVKLIGLEDRHEERRFEASGPVGPPDALAYCCPEEIMSARVDARGDVFSLGILVFEALVGQPLFGGQRHATTHPALAAIRATLGGPIPPLPASVPPRLRAAVVRSLARDPGQRFPSAVALGASLARCRQRDARRSREDLARLVSRALGDDPGSVRTAW